MRIRVVFLLLLSVALTACDESTPDQTAALFSVRACEGSGGAPAGETFRVRIEDPEVIREAERLIAEGEQRVITGPLVRGDGGFNEPWSWHLDPEGVHFADFTIELCDGCPHMVEGDLGYWVDTVGTYCPWSAEIVQRLE